MRRPCAEGGELHHSDRTQMLIPAMSPLEGTYYGGATELRSLRAIRTTGRGGTHATALLAGYCGIVQCYGWAERVAA